MSSILRALKKLDEDAIPLEDQTGNQKSNLRQMVNRRARGPRFKNRFLYISLAASLFVIAAAAALIIIKTAQEPTPEQKPDPSLAKKTEFLTTTPSDTVTQEAKRQPRAPEKIPVQQAIEKETKPESRPMVHPPKQHTITAPAAPTPRVIGQNPAPKSPMNPIRPQLTLHGILWSDNKDRRVALIGEKYLKEGDIIKGATIIKIEKKSVTLQMDDDNWTIRVK